MNISSYVFQSPYPNQIQIGRPDPAVQQQEQQNEAVDALAQNANQSTRQNAEAYLAQNQTGASVNVASVSTEPAVSTALEGFSSANTQAQAAAAYSE